MLSARYYILSDIQMIIYYFVNGLFVIVFKNFIDYGFFVGGLPEGVSQ